MNENHCLINTGFRARGVITGIIDQTATNKMQLNHQALETSSDQQKAHCTTSD